MLLDDKREGDKTYGWGITIFDQDTRWTIEINKD
jgi:hypothetical protein